MDDQLFTDVRGVVGDIFEVTHDDISAVATLEELPTFDSLRQLNLMLALEERFGVFLEPEDLPQLASVASIVELVTARR